MAAIAAAAMKIKNNGNGSERKAKRQSNRNNEKHNNQQNNQTARVIKERKAKENKQSVKGRKSSASK